MVEGLSHFAFTVSDIEASVHWYGTVLGLRLVVRQRQDNEYTRKMVGLGDAVLEVAEFELDPGHAASPWSCCSTCLPLGSGQAFPRLT